MDKVYTILNLILQIQESSKGGLKEQYQPAPHYVVFKSISLVQIFNFPVMFTLNDVFHMVLRIKAFYVVSTDEKSIYYFTL